MDGTKLTKAGKADLLNAPALQKKVNWTKIVLGDANGAVYSPDESQTSLRNQVWEGAINSIEVISESRIEFHTAVPAQDGPFDIREAGILNDQGALVAIAPVDEQHKASISGGIGTVNDLDFILGIDVENSQDFNLVVDPTVVLATRKYVDTQLAEFEPPEMMEVDESDINGIFEKLMQE